MYLNALVQDTCKQVQIMWQTVKTMINSCIHQCMHYLAAKTKMFFQSKKYTIFRK